METTIRVNHIRHHSFVIRHFVFFTYVYLPEPKPPFFPMGLNEYRQSMIDLYTQDIIKFEKRLELLTDEQQRSLLETRIRRKHSLIMELKQKMAANSGS